MDYNADMLSDPRQLARLVDLSVTLNSTLELAPLLQVLVSTAAELLDCEKASILLYNEARGDLSFVTALGQEADQLAEIPVPIEGSLAGAIFRAKTVLIHNNVRNDPRHFKTVGAKTAFETRKLLGVPMQLHGKTTGVMEALNKRTGDFNADDADVLAVVAAQAAVAIHNAQLVHDLQKAHDELSRVDKVKSKFMALATHELRTPLAVITGYAEFLQQGTQGTLSRHASRVLNAALKQREIIEQMTNMNLLQLGEFDLKLTTLSLHQVLHDAWEAEAEAAVARSQRHLAAPVENDVALLGDAERLTLAFRNIYHNAIRFTPCDGEIQTTVSSVGKEVQLAIRDTGVGIPAGELTNIFKDYYQVEDHMTRRHGGLGLGLAIARCIVILHGGRIWAESPGPNQGATIKIALPVKL